MEKSENEPKDIDSTITEMVTETYEIEFVEMESDCARVEPAMDAEYDMFLSAPEEDWDADLANNNSENIVIPLNPLAMASELDYPNFEQLSVEPSDEVIGVSTIISELIQDDLCPYDTLRFRLKIENFSAFFSQPSRLVSDAFKCRNIPFRLIVESRNTSIGAFLQRHSTGDENMDHGLEIVVTSCELSVVNQSDGSKHMKNFHNCFRTGSDWGFSDLITVHSGLGRYVHDNSIVIEVQVKADPPYCYSDFARRITGCVGIRNQGATCYMNSLLQVLYFITKFRTACYRIPTEMDDISSMPLALQKVFYNLEFSDTAVCTKNLTKSFGWSTVDVLMQHDIQEMMRVLIDRIESRMKNTLLEPILPSLFQGKFVSYVKCRDIEFSSQREEVFYDIQLSLDNSDNLYDSFKRYVSPEMMDDENKYHAGAHGLQAAEKGTLFMNLPPVMFLHLLRFQFDATTSQVMKNNNYFKFNPHIDLTEFVREDDTTSWKYTLFAVLSHSGGGSYGHYVAYINPSLKGCWFKFDDDKISFVQPSDAIDSNFGNSSDADEWTKSMQLNAYMLVYVRDSNADDVFEPVDPIYITDELKNSVERDAELERTYKSSVSTNVYVFLSAFLESGCRFRFTKCLPKFSLSRDSTTTQFKKMLQSTFKISDENRIRIWAFLHNSDTHIVYISDTAQVVQYFNEYRVKQMLPITVWAEMAPPGQELPLFDPMNDILVFYYYYCAEKGPIYIDYGYHARKSQINELIPTLNRLMDWSKRQLNIYRDVRETKVCLMDPSLTFSDYTQYYEPPKISVLHVIFEPTEHDKSTKLHNILLYYQDIMVRVNITMRHVDNDMPEFNFTISLNATFPELLDVVACRLNYDKNRIQIFNSVFNSDFLGDPIPSSSTGILSDLISGICQKFVLFYKCHAIDVIDVEAMHNFTFQFVHIDLKKSETLTVYLADNESIDSILAEAQKIVQPDQTHGSGKFRLLCVDGDHLCLVKDSKDIYESLAAAKSEGARCSRKKYRIEEIPKGEECVNENEINVVVFQQRQLTNTRPSFIFKINMNESWQCVKDRLRCRLNVSETKWMDCQPTVMHNDDVLDVDDAKCLSEYEELNSKFCICLNYKSKFAGIFSRNSNGKIEIQHVSCKRGNIL